MNQEELRILIADDMPHERLVIHSRLKKELQGFSQVRFQEAESAEEAVEISLKGKIDVVILDIDFSKSKNSIGMSGLEASKIIKSSCSNIYTIALSSHETQAIMEEAVTQWDIDWYLRRSAISYPQLAFMCKQALVAKLHSESKLVEPKYHIFTQSRTMAHLLRRVDQIQADQNVLIYGETGTGKELISRRIHANAKVYSSNEARPLKVLDCSTLSEDLFESEVFGHKKGAFTGATENKPGALELADGGDLFLDEIHNIPLNLQQKLLRVLNDGTYFSVGDNREKKAHFRIIAATNIPIEEAKAKGLLLSDFVARIDGVRVTVPSLKNRKEDIELLARLFLSAKSDVDKEFSQDAFAFLSEQSWPENIRQLRGLVETALIEAKIPIISESLVRQIYFNAKLVTSEQDKSETADLFTGTVRSLEASGLNLAEAMDRIEKLYLERASQRNKSVRSLADFTGYSRTKVKQRLSNFGITLSEE